MGCLDGAGNILGGGKPDLFCDNPKGWVINRCGSSGSARKGCACYKMLNYDLFCHFCSCDAVELIVD